MEGVRLRNLLIQLWRPRENKDKDEEMTRSFHKHFPPKFLFE